MTLPQTLLAKLIASVAVIATVAGVAYWRGHVAGTTSGKAQVATLQAQYATAQAKAIADAVAAQRAVDAKALADAERLAHAGQIEAAAAEADAASSRDALAKLRAQLKQETANDPDVAAWGGGRLPAGVRRVLDGSAD